MVLRDPIHADGLTIVPAAATVQIHANGELLRRSVALTPLARARARGRIRSKEDQDV
jgi:hypothetical protein